MHAKFLLGRDRQTFRTSRFSPTPPDGIVLDDPALTHIDQPLCNLLPDCKTALFNFLSVYMFVYLLSVV